MLAHRPDRSEGAAPDAKYCLTETESQAFVPFLVVRLGEKSDSLRKGVKAVLAKLLVVLPYSKILGYLLDVSEEACVARCSPVVPGWDCLHDQLVRH